MTDEKPTPPETPAPEAARRRPRQPAARRPSARGRARPARGALPRPPKPAAPAAPPKPAGPKPTDASGKPLIAALAAAVPGAVLEAYEFVGETTVKVAPEHARRSLPAPEGRRKASPTSST